VEEESRKRAGNTRRRHELPNNGGRGIDRRLTRVGVRELRPAGGVANAGRGRGSRRGPNVAVTGDVALPDDISLP
jgi:hypothetical protein